MNTNVNRIKRQTYSWINVSNAFMHIAHAASSIDFRRIKKTVGYDVIFTKPDKISLKLKVVGFSQ